MNKPEKNFATCKEFGKMLREVANLYAKMGDNPLCEGNEEYEYIAQRIGFITPKHGYEDYIRPLRDIWITRGFDVARAKKWGEYLSECREKEIEPSLNAFQEQYK